MASEETGSGYVIWGADHAVYGPVELPMLVNWIRDERVTADTWLYLERSDCWEKVAHVPELQMFFKGRGSARPVGASANEKSVSPGALRRIKILGVPERRATGAFHSKSVEVQQISQMDPSWSNKATTGTPCIWCWRANSACG